MKLNKKTIIGGLLGLFLLIGIFFCLLRPSYVREAAQILFENELVESNIIYDDSGSSLNEESSQVTEETGK